MKIKFISLAVLPLIMVALFPSCKKDSTTPSNTNTTTPTGFTFKVDGTLVTVDSANAILYNLRTGSSGAVREMDVYAFKAGAEVLEFHFEPKTGSKNAGTALGASVLMSFFETPVKSYDSESGALNLTTCDTTGKNIVGDFNFIGKDLSNPSNTKKVTITEGHMVVTKLSK